ncbi:hypothetical protein ACFLZH_05750 [Patescibacteria group bacterium]
MHSKGKGNGTMFNYLPRNSEIKFADLLAMTEKNVILLTVDQWRKIIDRSITAKTKKVDLVNKLFMIDPYIGFTADGYVAIYTGTEFPVEILANWTWLDTITGGTYPDSDIPVLTMDPIAPILQINRDLVTRFWQITMAAITEIPWFKISHGFSMAHTSYTFCVDTLQQVDMGDLDTHIYFGLVKNSGRGVVVKVDADTTINGVMTIEEPNFIEVRLDSEPVARN